MVFLINSGIKVIKFRALEDAFGRDITQLRAIQLRILKLYFRLQVFLIGALQMAPIGMPIFAFVLYAWLGGNVTPSIIFPAFSLFDGLFNSIITIPECLGYL